jgi:Two component regulator propeller.
VARTWTTDDGLPQTSVWALEEADTGYLWVGTLGGVARFDGHSFTIYEAATTSGLAGNTIREIVESSEGTLWIGTTNGVSTRRDGQFQQVDGVGPNYTTKISVER